MTRYEYVNAGNSSSASSSSSAAGVCGCSGAMCSMSRLRSWRRCSNIAWSSATASKSSKIRISRSAHASRRLLSNHQKNGQADSLLTLAVGSDALSGAGSSAGKEGVSVAGFVVSLGVGSGFTGQLSVFERVPGTDLFHFLPAVAVGGVEEVKAAQTVRSTVSSPIYA